MTPRRIPLRGPSEGLSVLAVTSEVPWPLDSGGHLRTYHLLRTLAGRFDVRLIVPDLLHTRAAATRALEYAGVEAHVIDVGARTVATETTRLLGATARREPYVLFARHRRSVVRRRLAREIHRRRPDVIYLDHLDSLVYADEAPGIPIVIDLHNVYSRLAGRAAAEATGILRRSFLRREAALLARMERRAAEVAHTVLSVSHEEARYFTSLGARTVLVPNGVDCAAYEPPAKPAKAAAPTILFVGSLAWPPNASAAAFLATEVLPEVRRQIPDARLSIVGKDPSAEVRALAVLDDHVSVAASVPDVLPFFHQSHVLAVPLQAGGGTRLKILEAFAAGLPVVSTPIGCEGLGTHHGEQLLVADRAGFAAAIVRLLRNAEEARQLADRARPFVRERYDWSVVGDDACDAVASAAETSRMEPAPIDRLIASDVAAAS
jgi:glycosyltransferase involved in cell wall biosynthesis